MSLEVLVLTTETPHHMHFVRELIGAGHHVSVLTEHQTINTRMEAGLHEKLRLDYERNCWFSGKILRFRDICPTETVVSVNSPEALEVLEENTCDVSIAFGTRWIRDDALRLLPYERWNLHGGDPQKYRGLDSHLWALYHNDHDSLITTIHVLAPNLDSGEIVSGSRIDVAMAPELYMLRAANTDLAIQLAIGSLAHLETVGKVARMPQAMAGRYYSSLPDELWNRCAQSYTSAVRYQAGRS